MDYIFQIIVRVIIVITVLPIHEVAHGYVAYKLGDNTAMNLGRLNLNPMTHFDIVGTTALILTGYGWAKPVPVNPYNFKNRKSGMALTALAGPMSNIIMALIMMILWKILFLFPTFFLTDILSQAFAIMVITNIGLAIFNLLPIPPLDGSRIIGFFLSDRANYMMQQYEQIIMIGLFVLMFTNVLNLPLGFLNNMVYSFLNFITGFIG